MAQVIVTFKVMPTGTDVDLDEMGNEIKKAVNSVRMSREPIAFGLVALNVTVVMEDEGGQLDAAEKKITSVSGVASVETTEITRAL
ncbi:MAG: elongation factor 1-beta [Candidatus Aenigmarchaeota archaeon]|nr:elongation factor 1-beta [Candidatus Aenigmarchaeota archaeon]